MLKIMANKFAITAGGNWNDDTTWSTTSGGANDTTKPTAADDVFLDANSGNVTIEAISVCRSLNCTGYTGTLTHNSFFSLGIGDATAGASNIALKFVAGMTYTVGSATSSTIVFVSTSATQQEIDFAGKTTGSVTFSPASGGNWQYTGQHTVSSSGAVTLTRGSLDINGQTCSWGRFDSNNSNTRSLTLGSSNITLTSTSQTSWIINNASGLTLSAASSTITCNGNAWTVTSGQNYGVVNVNIPSGATFFWQGAGTYGDITVVGAASKTCGFSINGNLSASGTFTCSSDSDINRILVQSNSVGSARTITAAVVVLTNTVDFQDITGAGAATWTTAGTGATYIGDCGGNSGITFTTAATQTATMSTNKNWSDVTIWTSRVPLPQDNVSGASITGGTLTADMPRLGKDITWTGATGSPTWAFGATSIFGSVTLISGMTISGTARLTFAGRGSHTITSAGKSWTPLMTIECHNGTYTLQDAFTISTDNDFEVKRGTFDSNGFTVTIRSLFDGASGTTRTINMGTSTWNLTRTTSNLWVWASAGGTFNGENGTIVVSTTSSSTRTFQGGGRTYGTLRYTVAGSTGTLVITGSNSFAGIEFSDITNARIIQFTAGTTTTIRSASGWQINGTSGKLMSIESATAATHTLTCSTGTISSDYLSITNSIAQGGATWYAGANSTSVSGNTGWIFSAPGPIRGVGYAALSQIERAYFVQKVGGAEPREPLNNIKRRYMSGFIGAGVSARTPLQQLEKLWLAKILANAGITTMNFNSVENLWKLVVISISQTPSNYLNDNKIKFYSNAS